MSESLLGSAQAPAEPVAAPVAAPVPFSGEEEWKNSLPENLRNDLSLSPRKNLAGLTQSFIHAQKAMGKDKLVIPGENSGEEEWTNVWRKLGVPEDAAKYDIKLKEGAKIDQEFFGKFKAAAHKAGVHPRQAQQLIEWYDGVNSEGAVKAQEMEQTKINQTKEALQKEWGEAFPSKLAKANHAAKKIMTAEEYEDFIGDPEVGNNPKIIRFLERVGTMVGGDKILDGNSQVMGESGDDIERQINNHYADAKGPYLNANHADHARAVSEMEKLFMKKAMFGKAG